MGKQELQQGAPLQGGKYIIKRVLGQGGFGITYLAEQVSLKREVAVKEFFMRDLCDRDEASGEIKSLSQSSATQVERYRKKFHNEALLLAQLDHPHIISVIDVFEQNGTVYYSMPFLKAGSLKAFVESNGKLSEERALRYISQIASALKYMHEEEHLCHLDVKPANILVDGKDNAVIIDFGISKHYDTEGNETTSTPICLSECFAPIEQYQQMLSEFSPSSDVYSLGATLYYLITGKTPPSALALAQGDYLVFDDSLSSNTRDLVEKAMKVSLRDRLQNVNSFLLTSRQQQQVEKKELTTPTAETRDSNEDTIVPQNENSTNDVISSIIKRPIIKRILLIISIVIVFIWLINKCAQSHNKQDKSPDTIELPSDSIIIEHPSINKLQEDMVFVEGGAFMMGATKEQGDSAKKDEKPVHKVVLSDFYICKYEVTQSLWEDVMGSNPGRFFGDENSPVEKVSWFDCQKFIVKLNQITGKQYRLPTEAEWEYAARGGNRSDGYMFAGGNDASEVALYNLIDTLNIDYRLHVGTRASNELGLYDMSGCVWEWCQDWYGSYTNETKTDPTGPSSGNLRVYRGGAWNSKADCCRTSYRGCRNASFKSDNLGFRLAMDQ